MDDARRQRRPRGGRERGAVRIELDLSAKQLRELRVFAEDWAHWHLDGRKMSDADALMVCVLYTAVGPINANEVGACGADPAEIDEPDLVTAIKARLDKAARKASK